MTYYTTTFSTVAELVECGTDDRNGCSHKTGGAGWRGSDTWSEAIDLWQAGWIPGLHEMARQLETIELPTVVNARVTTRYDVAGGAVDVGRYLSGDPQCMRRVVMAPSRPIVRVAVPGCPLAVVSAETIMACGAATVALVDLLAQSGYGVEIVMVDADALTRATVDGDVMVTVVGIKAAHEPVDLGAVAFAMAHPAMFRRFLFGAYGQGVYRSAEGRKISGSRQARSAVGDSCSVGTSGVIGELGVDVDLSAPMSSRDDPVRRVVDALARWADRNA